MTTNKTEREKWLELLEELEAEQEKKIKEHLKEPLRILKVEVGKAPQDLHIKNEYAEFSEIVGGYLENVHIDGNVYMVCNEDGLMMDLPLNRMINDMPIVGNFFLVRIDALLGEYVSLSEDEVNIFRHVFSAKHIFLA